MDPVDRFAEPSLNRLTLPRWEALFSEAEDILCEVRDLGGGGRTWHCRRAIVRSVLISGLV
jgi:hypothetical protein